MQRDKGASQSEEDATRNVFNGNLFKSRKRPMAILDAATHSSTHLSPRHAMSSTTEPSPNPPHDLPKNNVDDDDLAASLEKLTLLSAENSLEVPSGFAGASDENSTLRPLIVYTRKELIHLSTSPLVKVPDRMPAFKAWFGCVRFRGSSFSSA